MLSFSKHCFKPESSGYFSTLSNFNLSPLLLNTAFFEMIHFLFINLLCHVGFGSDTIPFQLCLSKAKVLLSLKPSHAPISKKNPHFLPPVKYITKRSWDN